MKKKLYTAREVEFLLNNLGIDLHRKLGKYDTNFDEVKEVVRILTDSNESTLNLFSNDLSNEDCDFIVDNALNGLLNHCQDRLTSDRHVGDIEKKNLSECSDNCKRIMKTIDKTLF